MNEMSVNFITRNCVNRVRSPDLNPAHGRNVVGASGQHQTVIKLPEQHFLRLATVNVGSLRGRSNEVVETVSRRNVDICCIQEVRWRGAGTKFISGKDCKYKFFWVGNTQGTAGVGIFLAEKFVENVIHVERVNDRLMLIKLLLSQTIVTVVSAYAPQQGLSDSEKDTFYDTLIEKLAQSNEKEIVFLAGDLNGHVGNLSDGYDHVHGSFGFGSRNREGERILEFSLAMDMVVCNTLFKKRDSHLITYSSGGTNTQIDYILTKTRDKKLVCDIKVIPGEEVFTQHKLVLCDLKLSSSSTKKKPHTPKLKVWKLEDKHLRSNFAEVFSKKVDRLAPTHTVEDSWLRIKDLLLESSELICGRTTGLTHRKETWWWNSEVDKVIKAKRQLWNDWKNGRCPREEYNIAKKAAKRAVYNAKTEAAKAEFGNVSMNGANRNIFRIAKQLKGQNQDIIGDTCIKNDDGFLVFSDNDKLLAWEEHYQKLLNVEFPWDSNHLDMLQVKAGPVPLITSQEIIKALNTMSNHKAGSISGIVTEMFKASGNAGIELLSTLFNQILKEKVIPSDWEKSIIVNLYKGKGDALDRGNYRGLKLLEHCMKLFEKVIEQHIRCRIEINQMQFGFMPGKSTIDAIFIVRQIQEKYREKKKDLYFAFVDLEKAFDRVPRKVVFWAMRKAGLDEWIIDLLSAMYKNAKSSVRVNGKLGREIPVNVGLHQGSVLSPLLFIIVLEALSSSFRIGLPWELLYADDLVLIAESIAELEVLYERWKTSMESKGLRVNIKKTKVMCSQSIKVPLNKCGKHPCSVCWKGVGSNSIRCTSCKYWTHKKCTSVKGNLSAVTGFVCKRCLGEVLSVSEDQKVRLIDDDLDHVSKFCYLGDMLDSNACAESSVICRIQCGWKKFREILPLLTSKSISPKIRGHLYNACIRSVMLYSGETWPVKVEDESRLKRTEITMIRWMCGSKLKEKKSNDQLLSVLGLHSIIDELRKRRLRWFGHITRREENNWVRLIQEFQVDGARAKGRPQKRWAEVIEADLKRYSINRNIAIKRNEWKKIVKGIPKL